MRSHKRRVDKLEDGSDADRESWPDYAMSYTTDKELDEIITLLESESLTDQQHQRLLALDKKVFTDSRKVFLNQYIGSYNFEAVKKAFNEWQKGNNLVTAGGNTRQSISEDFISNYKAAVS